MTVTCRLMYTETSVLYYTWIETTEHNWWLTCWCKCSWRNLGNVVVLAFTLMGLLLCLLFHLIFFCVNFLCQLLFSYYCHVLMFVQFPDFTEMSLDLRRHRIGRDLFPQYVIWTFIGGFDCQSETVHVLLAVCLPIVLQARLSSSRKGC